MEIWATILSSAALVAVFLIWVSSTVIRAYEYHNKRVPPKVDNACELVLMYGAVVLIGSLCGMMLMGAGWFFHLLYTAGGK